MSPADPTGPETEGAGGIWALVAEEDPVTRETLTEHLRSRGFRVLTARDGEQARRMLLQYPGLRLLISDWRLPGCDGPELCRAARQQMRPRYLHILVLTVRSDKQQGLEAIQAGADAFLLKPVAGPELLAQVEVARRVLALEDDNWRRIQELDRINQSIQKDMEAATRVQQSFLPEQVVRAARTNCASFFRPSTHVAGDMFNHLELPGGLLAAYVLDVSGHGTQAALLSVSIQLLLESLAGSGGEAAGREEIPLEDPVEVLRALNRRFPVMAQSGQFFTMLYGVLDPQEGVFRYARAGHPWPVVVDARGATLLEEGSGSALGVFPEVHLEQQTITLHPGAMVVLYSDGVTEARSASDRRQEFGTERLMEVLEKARGQGVEAAVLELQRVLLDFVGPRGLHDDATVLGVEWLPGPGPARPGRGVPAGPSAPLDT